ncbi:MAG: BrnA antitoxin family protein [Rhizobiaceae bacterium]|nr:BrnA antitoxin family protein [Rhizobiaceae bacterium]
MTPEEDAAITADAMSDPDSLPMTDEEFAAARRVPLSEALPFQEAVLPLDADVLARLEAEGPDWRIRANAILRAALETA